MPHSNFDNDELLRLSLAAIGDGRDAESVSLLKTLLERVPGHAYGLYLLAAQYAQMGLLDRAEEGFRAALSAAPDLVMARFQLGQLLLVQSRTQEAKQAFSPIAASPQGQAIGAYARALTSAADEDVASTVAELEAGLACAQDIPALADDMRRLVARLVGPESALEIAGGSVAPMFLSGYSRQG
jgi:tetratricopeptide (TPR) repeat protein